MFTGIVQNLAKIESIKGTEIGKKLKVKVYMGFNYLLKTGSSISVNGVCLTVTGFSYDYITFDVIKETLRTTNLGELKVGEEVNIERSLKFGDEVGGHILSGHISCKCNAKIKKKNGEVELIVKKPDFWGKYIFPKGFVALNGVSLTVGSVQEESFSVYLIPETLNLTNLLSIEKGFSLNLEVDQNTVAMVNSSQHN